MRQAHGGVSGVAGKVLFLTWVVITMCPSYDNSLNYPFIFVGFLYLYFVLQCTILFYKVLKIHIGKSKVRNVCGLSQKDS